MFRIHILILIIICFLVGCKVKVKYPSEFPSKTIITREENYWFWGLIGEKNYEVYNICPSGRIYEIKISNTFLQSTFTFFTLGIYSPKTTTIICSIRGDEVKVKPKKL